MRKYWKRGRTKPLLSPMSIGLTYRRRFKPIKTNTFLCVIPSKRGGEVVRTTLQRTFTVLGLHQSVYSPNCLLNLQILVFFQRSTDDFLTSGQRRFHCHLVNIFHFTYSLKTIIIKYIFIDDAFNRFTER